MARILLALLLAFAACSTGTAWGLCIEKGHALPTVVLDSSDGHHSGRIVYNDIEKQIHYESWSPDSLTGKPFVLYHLAARHGIDEVNGEFIRSLGKLPPHRYQLVVMLNIDDVFIGGKFFARSTFEDHAKKDGDHTTFVLDDHSAVRDAWCIQPQSSTVILLNATGEIIDTKDGALTPDEQDRMLRNLRR